MNVLVKFARLPAADRRLVARAGLTLVLVRAGLMMLRVRNLRWMLDRFRSRPAEASAARPAAAKIAWAVAAANRVARGNCLPKALAAELMLRHYGYPAELKLGAGRDPVGGFIAHAWVECEGRVVIGDFEPGSYTELARDAARAGGPLAGRLS